MAVSGGDERHESLVSTLCGLWTRGAGDEVIVSVTNLGRESDIEGALLWGEQCAEEEEDGDDDELPPRWRSRGHGRSGERGRAKNWPRLRHFTLIKFGNLDRAIYTLYHPCPVEPAVLFLHLLNPLFCFSASPPCVVAATAAPRARARSQ